MKKSLLLAAAALATASASVPAAAQETATPEPKVYSWEGILSVNGEDSYLAGPMNGVSGNGNWAVGYDAMFSGMSFVWTRSTGELTYMADCQIYDVANDGTIVGNFKDEDGYVQPGYYKNGVWTALPLPEGTRATKSLDYGPYAALISDDGRVITGTSSAAVYRTIQWVDGELKEFPEVKNRNVGTLMCDQMQDGSVLVGLSASEIGDHLPCYIKDGQAHFIVENPEGVDGETSGLTRELIEGRIAHIMEDGMAYGYYNDTEGASHTFVVDTNTGVVADADVVIMGKADEGVYYTSGMSVWDGTSTTSLSEYLGVSVSGGAGISAASNDGSVVVGAGIQVSEIGEMNFPFVIDRGEGSTTGIENAAAADRLALQVGPNGTVNFSAGVTAATVYDAQGRQVMTAAGQSVNLGAQPKGTYLIRVTTANGQHSTFKVMR